MEVNSMACKKNENAKYEVVYKRGTLGLETEDVRIFRDGDEFLQWLVFQVEELEPVLIVSAREIKKEVPE